jgi:hypothetical protein
MSTKPAKSSSSPAAGRRRRRHARYRSDFPVVVNLLAGDEYRRLDAHCKDLSEAGIGMLVAAELAIGEVAALHFSLPGAREPWEIRAVLRHRRGYHYGFEFLSLTRQQSEVLGSYLQKQERVDTE